MQILGKISSFNDLDLPVSKYLFAASTANVTRNLFAEGLSVVTFEAIRIAPVFCYATATAMMN
jgi:hypothetical protein